MYSCRKQGEEQLNAFRMYALEEANSEKGELLYTICNVNQAIIPLGLFQEVNNRNVALQLTQVTEYTLGHWPSYLALL